MTCRNCVFVVHSSWFMVHSRELRWMMESWWGVPNHSFSFFWVHSSWFMVHSRELRWMMQSWEGRQSLFLFLFLFLLVHSSWFMVHGRELWLTGTFFALLRNHFASIAILFSIIGRKANTCLYGIFIKSYQSCLSLMP